MTAPEPIKSLLLVTKRFEKDCIVWMAAPYSRSDQCLLPEGLVLNLYEFPNRPDSVRYEASPVEPLDWAPFLLSSDNRFDRNFRGSISFHLSKTEIEQNCEFLSELPTEEPSQLRLHRALQGCLFGTLVGDAIGLPFEGLSRRRIQEFKPVPLRHRFLFGRGMMSDDTEHTCLVADALIHSRGDPDQFARLLAWRMRFWFLGLPAGIGLATLRACLKLWCFIPPKKSGVFSAGNGPAMRSAIVGVYAYDDPQLREQLIAVNTRITHTDPKAIKGALIVAELAARNAQNTGLDPEECLADLSDLVNEDAELRELLGKALESAKADQSAVDFCQTLNLRKGVSGYIYHTLPVVVQIVLRHGANYEQAITEAVACGGDTDTVAAIVGGIVGARVGKAGIPQDWVENCRDWPRDKTYIRLLAEELAMTRVMQRPGYTQWIDPIRIWIRNAFFMAWVLAHGFRRLLPPY